jgi:hypothetical protein
LAALTSRNLAWNEGPDRVMTSPFLRNAASPDITKQLIKHRKVSLNQPFCSFTSLALRTVKWSANRCLSGGLEPMKNEMGIS